MEFLLGFLVFWLGTIITSFSMEIANELKMFKDVADAGYKIDVKRMSELGEQLNPNESKIVFQSMLIPIVNMMQVFQRTMRYNSARAMILDQLSVMDILEEMSENEKTEYLKKPTGLNAIIIPIKTKINFSTTMSLKIKDGNEQSEIFFKMGESLEDITILKASGSASRLTVEEQKKKVIETWKNMVQVGMEKYGDKETLINALSNNTIIDSSDGREDKKEEEPIPQTTQELIVSEQKQSLENLKSELLEKKGSTLSHRIK